MWLGGSGYDLKCHLCHNIKITMSKYFNFKNLFIKKNKKFIRQYSTLVKRIDVNLHLDSTKPHSAKNG